MLKRVCDVPGCDATLGDKFHVLKISLDESKETVTELCDSHYDIINTFLGSPEKIKVFFKGQNISKGRHGSTKK
jgi:hypothetical protein